MKITFHGLGVLPVTISFIYLAIHAWIQPHSRVLETSNAVTYKSNQTEPRLLKTEPIFVCRTCSSRNMAKTKQTQFIKGDGSKPLLAAAKLVAQQKKKMYERKEYEKMSQKKKNQADKQVSFQKRTKFRLIFLDLDIISK